MDLGRGEGPSISQQQNEGQRGNERGFPTPHNNQSSVLTRCDRRISIIEQLGMKEWRAAEVINRSCQCQNCLAVFCLHKGVCRADDGSTHKVRNWIVILLFFIIVVDVVMYLTPKWIELLGNLVGIKLARPSRTHTVSAPTIVCSPKCWNRICSSCTNTFSY